MTSDRALMGAATSFVAAPIKARNETGKRRDVFANSRAKTQDHAVAGGAGGFGFDMMRLRSVMPQTVREKIGRQAPICTRSIRRSARDAARWMTVEPRSRGGVLLRFAGSRVRVAFVTAIGLFLWCVGQFHDRDTGFSSLISIGEVPTLMKVSALRAVPHYVYEGSAGYDGAYYVQLALDPTLDNPELTRAIDNLPYRARRILFSWVAWVIGAAQPAWIVQVFALLNVACWLVLAVVLLRWFPLEGWGNFLRWAGVMFSHGVCMSVRHSLVDAPSLLLVALALRWLEDGRRRAGAVTLAFAGLGKETSLIAGVGLDFDWRAPRTWGRPALTLIAIALPLAAWMGYVRWKFGPAEDPGMGNFTLPFAGLVEKLAASWRDLVGPDSWALNWAVLATMIALIVQWLFFVLRWRPAERWWRVGAAFALMMVFLSTPVWEGYPGAATRVLLPMTLAFNVLVPRGGRWLPILIAGNLTVAASVFEFTPPTAEFYDVRGAARSAVRVVPAEGWHGAESGQGERWRWASGNAKLVLINEATSPVLAAIHGEAVSVEGFRHVRVLVDGKLLWGETVGRGATEVRFGLALRPGETVVEFTSDRPAQKVHPDPRDLAFRIANLDIVVKPLPDH